MTDMWADEGDSDADFFSMSDEDYAAYQRRVLRGPEDTDTAPQLPCTPPKQGSPDKPPAIDRERSAQPLTEVEEFLNFNAGCEKCPDEAAHLICWHPVGRCTHPVYGGERLQHLLVCDFHLEAYEQKASIVVAEMNPPWFVRFFKEAKRVCPSCGAPVQVESDVLQVVRGI